MPLSLGISNCTWLLYGAASSAAGVAQHKRQALNVIRRRRDYHEINSDGSGRLAHHIKEIIGGISSAASGKWLVA